MQHVLEGLVIGFTVGLAADFGKRWWARCAIVIAACVAMAVVRRYS